MGIFDYFGRRAREKWELEKEFLRERHEQKLDIERRRKEIGLSIDEKRAELERLRLDYQIKDQNEKMIDDFEEVIDEDGEDSDTMKILAPAIAKLINPAQSSPVVNNSGVEHSIKQSPPTSTTIELNDDEIETIYQSTDKKYIKLARSMDDETIKKFLLSKQPNLSEDTIKRAISRIKR